MISTVSSVVSAPTPGSQKNGADRATMSSGTQLSPSTRITMSRQVGACPVMMRSALASASRLPVPGT